MSFLSAPIRSLKIFCSRFFDFLAAQRVFWNKLSLNALETQNRRLERVLALLDEGGDRFFGPFVFPASDDREDARCDEFDNGANNRRDDATHDLRHDERHDRSLDSRLLRALEKIDPFRLQDVHGVLDRARSDLRQAPQPDKLGLTLELHRCQKHLEVGIAAPALRSFGDYRSPPSMSDRPSVTAIRPA